MSGDRFDKLMRALTFVSACWMFISGLALVALSLWLIPLAALFMWVGFRILDKLWAMEQ